MMAAPEMDYRADIGMWNNGKMDNGTLHVLLGGMSYLNDRICHIIMNWQMHLPL